MQFEYKNSFYRSLEALRSTERKEAIRLTLKEFILAIDRGGPLPYGTGLKRLRKNFYEIRSGLGDRVVYRRQGGLIEFVLVGNHDEIKRFLRGSA